MYSIVMFVKYHLHEMQSSLLIICRSGTAGKNAHNYIVTVSAGSTVLKLVKLAEAVSSNKSIKVGIGSKCFFDDMQQ